MPKHSVRWAVREFPYGSMVTVPYKGWNCDGTVLDHTRDGQVRVALHTADEGNQIINLYGVESLSKIG